MASPFRSKPIERSKSYYSYLVSLSTKIQQKNQEMKIHNYKYTKYVQTTVKSELLKPLSEFISQVLSSLLTSTLRRWVKITISNHSYNYVIISLTISLPEVCILSEMLTKLQTVQKLQQEKAKFFTLPPLWQRAKSNMSSFSIKVQQMALLYWNNRSYLICSSVLSSLDFTEKLHL